MYCGGAGIIFQWNGKGASRKEKAAAMEKSGKMKNDRGAKPIIVLCEEGVEPFEFWESMPGGKADIAPEGDEDSDKKAEASAKDSIKLFRVSDKGGKMECKEEGSYPLKREMLDTGDCFVVQTADVLYVWVGKAVRQQAGGRR